MNQQLKEQGQISLVIDNGGSDLMIGPPISISNTVTSMNSLTRNPTTVEVLPHNYIMQLDSIQESIQELYDNLSVHDIHHKLHEIENMIDKLRNTDFKLDQSESITINTPAYAPTPNDLVINKELCYGGIKSQGTITFKDAEIMSMHVSNSNSLFNQMSVDPLSVKRVPYQEVHLELRCSDIEETSN